MNAKNMNHGGHRPHGTDPKPSIVHIIEYGAARSVGVLVRLLPPAWGRAIGRLIGDLWYAVDARHRKVAMVNLDLVFGATKTEAEKIGIVRRAHRHFGMMLVEILRFPKINERNFLKRIDIDNIGPLYQALDRGKGLVLVTAHYGNWELMGLVLGYLNRPLSVMARPFKNPLIHAYLEKLRCQSGNRVIYKHRSIRKMMSNLKENRIVGIVNDQDVHDHNCVFSSFFGQQASVSPLPAALALKMGAPLITGFAIPQGRGRYLLRFGELIHGQLAADKDAEIQRITQELNRRLERQIQFQPDCWMWMHQRFKTTPQGRHQAYDRPRTIDDGAIDA